MMDQPLTSQKTMSITLIFGRLLRVFFGISLFFHVSDNADKQNTMQKVF